MAVTTHGLTREALSARVRGSFAGTRGLLRGRLAATVAAILVFAAVAAASVEARRTSLASARSAAAQVVLLQRVRTALVEADALATNVFLVGGLEPAKQRDGYENGVKTAAQTLTAASSAARPSDVAPLGAANAALVRYTGLIESARANNRQGYPVGVAYLKQASALLRSGVLPVLDRVSASSQERFDDAYVSSENARYALLGGSVLVLGVLLGCQVLLSKRTRRTFNIPLVAATALIVTAVVWSGATMTVAASHARRARAVDYQDASALAGARIDAFAAKSSESLTLIARGNGAAYETAWSDSYGEARTLLDGRSFSATAAELANYGAVHEKIRRLDDTGDWDGAVALATGFSPSSANATFAAFDVASGRRLDEAARRLDQRVHEAGSPLGAARAGLALLAFAAVGLAAWGYAQRLREYR